MQTHDVVEHLFSDVCADSLPQPGDQIKPHKRTHRHSRGNTDKQDDCAFQVRTRAAAKALVDQHLQAATQR